MITRCPITMWTTPSCLNHMPGCPPFAALTPTKNAVASAKRLFGSAVELVLSSGDPDMDWPQFAGARDWQD